MFREPELDESIFANYLRKLQLVTSNGIDKWFLGRFEGTEPFKIAMDSTFRLQL